MKGKHLEGERGSGLDTSTDITKLVIPMSMDSLITRAATSGPSRISQAACIRRKFSARRIPAAAIALPIRFQGETAVLYADSETAWEDAHGVRHSAPAAHRNPADAADAGAENAEGAARLRRHAAAGSRTDVPRRHREQAARKRSHPPAAGNHHLRATAVLASAPRSKDRWRPGCSMPRSKSLSAPNPIPLCQDLAAAVRLAQSQRTACGA